MPERHGRELGKFGRIDFVNDDLGASAANAATTLARATGTRRPRGRRRAGGYTR